MRTRKKNDTKNIIIAIIFLAIVFMTAGYAIYTRDLIINGVGKITTDWDVRFTDINLNHEHSTLEEDAKGYANEESSPIISGDGTSMTIDISLVYTTDRVSYEIDITNFSEMFDAEYKGATISTNAEEDYILYDITNINVGDKILADSTGGMNPNIKTIMISSYWNPSKITNRPETIPHTELATITLVFEASAP